MPFFLPHHFPPAACRRPKRTASLPRSISVGRLLSAVRLKRARAPCRSSLCPLWQAKKRFWREADQSDHLTTLNAYEAWDSQGNVGGRYRFCHENFLSPKTLEAVAGLKRQCVPGLRRDAIEGSVS